MKVEFYYSGKPSEFHQYDVPIKVITDSFLDEMLDTSAIELRDTDRREPYAPFTIVQMGTQPVSTYWMVGSDIVQEVRATGFYNHTVQLIEPTKWLERWMVGNKAVTQPVYTDYSAFTVQPTSILGLRAYSNSYDNYGITELLPGYEYVTPVVDGDTVNVYPPFCFKNQLLKEQNSILTSDIKIKYHVVEDGVIIKEEERIYTDLQNQEKPETYAPLYSFTAKENKTYTIVYTLATRTYAIDTFSIYYGEYFFCAVPEKISLKRKTLLDAAESFIYAAQNLLEGEESLFSIDIHNKLLDLTAEAPELTVTNATLREALDEIGKCIGAITVLNIREDKDNDKFKYEIFFEKFCKNEQANLEALGEGTDVIIQRSCEDYCTALDATVENLVQYSEGGSIVDPDPIMGKTLRTEDTTYRITEDTGEIFTEFPIERLDKVEMSIDCGVRYDDITSYCFESAEYATLSSYSPTYPLSKAYSLKYTLGSRNITGLNFTVPNPMHDIFSKPSLVNIVNKVFGTNYTNLNGLDFTKPLFRVTYVPTGAARIRMRKPNSLGKPESVLAFNQSAAKLDARAFGRNMFGAVLRMGNTETQTTYVVPIGATIPEKGQRVGDDGYIAEVRTEYAIDTKKVTLTVVEGFNRLSAFVGVNQSLRMYEISERMSLDRHLIYEDFCCISTDRAYFGENDPIAQYDLINWVPDLLSNNTHKKLFLNAITQGYDKKGTALKKCIFPCLSYGLGNALVIACSFEDNYSAGKRVDPYEKKLIDQSEQSKKNEYEKHYYRTQSDVQYSNFFGEVDKMALKLIAFADGTASHKGDIEKYANALPEFELSDSLSTMTDAHVLVDTGTSKRLLIDKDSRERIKSITYQLNFMTNDSLILSYHFAEKLQSKSKSYKFVVLDYLVNSLTDKVAGIASVTANLALRGQGNMRYLAMSSTFPTCGVAWAFVEADTDHFLFGKNGNVNAGDKIPNIYFSFLH